MLVADVTTAGFEPEIERAVQPKGIAALAFVPLVHGDRLLGKFMLYRDEPHEWGDREIRLCRTIANHIASATVRTRARIALRESREQLETIMRTVDEGIIVQSTRRPARLRERRGRAHDRLRSRRRICSRATAPRRSRASRCSTSTARRSLPTTCPGGARSGESSEQLVRYRIRATGEERWSVVRANPVHGPDGDVVLAVSVIHDVTETKAAEERLRFLGARRARC